MVMDLLQLKNYLNILEYDIYFVLYIIIGANY